MHNAYCDADENSLDLRIHPKQHTTCASVSGKRSKSYNYGIALVLLLLPLVFRLRSPSSFSSNKHFLTARERSLTLTGPARRH
ncbi:hypothetical protein pdam_00025280 [Pocillopora damicornis]|uniref:Uncharacterized protein n=1 Tax=Pocillopora damicornis TaxID=46731 RepID=A0A3M6UAB2_POCDA|nr:hypothetical protein pdam_00025280 [Pocillopora damicornis]